LGDGHVVFGEDGDQVADNFVVLAAGLGFVDEVESSRGNTVVKLFDQVVGGVG
jgi:hypothetical protein